MDLCEPLGASSRTPLSVLFGHGILDPWSIVCCLWGGAMCGLHLVTPPGFQEFFIPWGETQLEKRKSKVLQSLGPV